MKATHSVKVNGQWYHAGDELPASGSVAKPTPVVQEAVVRAPEPEKAPDPVPEPVKGPTPYTAEQLKGMRASELRKLAVEHGQEHADDMTGSELKNWLTKKLYEG